MRISTNKKFQTSLVYTALFSVVGMWLMIMVPSARGGPSKPQGTSQECRNFVQQFYNWYISGPQPKGNQSQLDVALKDKSSSFSPILRQKLQEDIAASKKDPGEIVGLDFDPITNAQITLDRFIVGKATTKAGHCFVEAYGVVEGKKSARPDVNCELAQQNGHWVFINFHYPSAKLSENTDLLNVLKILAADRAKYAQSNHK